MENHQWNRKKLSLNECWITRYCYVIGTSMCQVFHTRSPAPQNDIIRGVTVSKDDSADPQTPRKPPLTGDSWAEDQERICFSGKKKKIYIYMYIYVSSYKRLWKTKWITTPNFKCLIKEIPEAKSEHWGGRTEFLVSLGTILTGPETLSLRFYWPHSWKETRL